MDLARRGHSNPSAPSPTQPDSSPSNHSDPNDSDYNPRKKHKRGGDNSSGSKHKQRNGGSSESKQKKGCQGSRRSKQSGRRVITRQLSTGFSVTVGEVYLPEFECQDILGEGRSGKKFRADWRGETVAVKICDLYQHPEYEEEILTEVAVYDTLRDLQGLCIPHFKLAGYYGGIFVIATEIAGFPLDVDKLSHHECLEILNKLSLIHMHGILHNDIRRSNILVHRLNDGMKVCFIDFAMSKRGCNKSEFKHEMIQLEKLLGLSVSETLNNLYINI